MGKRRSLFPNPRSGSPPGTADSAKTACKNRLRIEPDLCTPTGNTSRSKVRRVVEKSYIQLFLLVPLDYGILKNFPLLVLMLTLSAK